MSKNTDVIDLQSLVACFSLYGENLEHRLEVIQSSGLKIGSLDTVPATINGGIWYEVSGGLPVVKIYYDGNAYPITGSASDPDLTITPSTATINVTMPAVFQLSYDGDGAVTVSSGNSDVLPVYNSASRIITINYADPEVLGSVPIYVDIGAGTSHFATREQFNVVFEKISPNLTIDPITALIIPEGGTFSANVTFDGTGTIGTPISNNANVTATYNDGTITIPHVIGTDTATITIPLSASRGYTADTASVTVTMAEVSPNLTVTPSANVVPIDGSITAEVSYDSSGTITVLKDDIDVTTSYYDATNKIITIPYERSVNPVTFTVNLSTSPGYASDTKNFTISMEQPVILTITPIAPRAHSLYGAYSSENVIVRDTTTTVSCISNGTISVESDKEEVVPTYDEETQTITIPFYNFGRDTEVTITVSVTADGIYPAAQDSLVVTYAGDYKNMTDLTGWSGMLNAPIFARLQTAFPFNTSPTQDLFCGSSNTSVSTNGSPTISENALFLDGQSAVVKTKPAMMTQMEMGVRFWFRILDGTPIGACIFDLWNTANNRANSVYLQYNGTANGTYKLRLGHGTAYADTSCPTTGWHHIEVGLNGSKIYCFINGTLKIETTTSLTKGAFSYLYIGRSNTSPTKYFTGYIDGFKIYETMQNLSAYSAPPRPTY